jgi:nucleoside-diphosphate-sugar epimerase
MQLLVTGVDGYIGALLAPVLMRHGHSVTGLDTGFYRAAWLYNDPATAPLRVTKDIRDVTVEDLKGFDAVVHLAELSNDPLGQLNPTITHEINHHGSARLARLAKEAGVSRFVYMSSCSVYGVGNDDYKTEMSEPLPQTAYAECKVLMEQELHQLASDDFSPTCLRNATAYGASPRMRFDLVVNNLAGLAWTTRTIAMTSDGTPWRPLVHALDISQAIACVLDAPRQVVHDQILNVGDNTENYRIRGVAEIINEVFPECQVTFGEMGADNRSYRVSFDKIHELLPSFACKHTVLSGAKTLRQIFERTEMTGEVFNSPPYTRIKQLEQLLNTKQLDDHLYWN